MELIYEQNRIYTTNASGKMIAEVTFPALDDSTVEINHTFVDEVLRGQGAAGKLMEAAATHLQGQQKRAVLTCSYAIKWFGQHPEYNDLIKK